jgi:hypothetical protein
MQICTLNLQPPRLPLVLEVLFLDPLNDNGLPIVGMEQL